MDSKELRIFRLNLISQTHLLPACPSRSGHSSIPLDSFASTYDSILSGSSASAVKPGIHALLHTDCSNISAGISQGNRRAKERTARIARNHLRDLQKFLTIAY